MTDPFFTFYLVSSFLGSHEPRYHFDPSD